MLIPFLAVALLLQAPHRTIAIDERLAADARLGVGDKVMLSAIPSSPTGDTVIVGAVVKRGTDPAEVARSEIRIRVHLDQLQSIAGYGDRVDRFAVATRDEAATEQAIDMINSAAFGFQAHRSKDIAVATSKTFLVVNRFHAAIGVITIVASAIFLLCIMLLKVEERRLDAAVMRFVGVRRRTIFGALLLEASLVAALGCLLGTGLAYLAGAATNAYYRRFFDTVLTFSVITPDIVWFSVVLSLVLGGMAGALAAWRLVQTRPLVLWGRG